jgi:hypothetical protein
LSCRAETVAQGTHLVVAQPIEDQLQLFSAGHGPFACKHCNTAPELLVDGQAQLAIVRHAAGCPTLLAQVRTIKNSCARRGASRQDTNTSHTRLRKSNTGVKKSVSISANFHLSRS